MFAGIHSFNGNGEMTGWAWIAEQGLLASPLCITNTHSVGVVRDAICALAVRDKAPMPWLLPVVAETYDGWLSDASELPGHHRTCDRRPGCRRVRPDRRGQCRWRHRHDLPRVQGRHRHRIARRDDGGESYTVGALVQANYGARELLRVDGVPVGREIGTRLVPSHRDAPRDAGSIIVVLATDAPLLPIQCQRLARRATTGLAWVGGIGANGSGDIFLAFATGNHVRQGEAVATVRMIAPDRITPLFQAAAEATEEAILNALTVAETMTGLLGHTAHALPLDQLAEVMRRYRPASGTVNHTHSRLSTSNAAVTANTQRMPMVAATAPPVSGPSVLPTKYAEETMP